MPDHKKTKHFTGCPPVTKFETNNKMVKVKLGTFFEILIFIPQADISVKNYYIFLGIVI